MSRHHSLYPSLHPGLQASEAAGGRLGVAHAGPGTLAFYSCPIEVCHGGNADRWQCALHSSGLGAFRVGWLNSSARQRGASALRPVRILKSSTHLHGLPLTYGRQGPDLKIGSNSLLRQFVATESATLTAVADAGGGTGARTLGDGPGARALRRSGVARAGAARPGAFAHASLGPWICMKRNVATPTPRHARQLRASAGSLARLCGMTARALERPFSIPAASSVQGPATKAALCDGAASR
jgi:hypothetical protein